MPVPNGDTDHFRGRKELEVAPAGLPGVPTRGRLLMRSELPGPCLWTETTAVSMKCLRWIWIADQHFPPKQFFFWSPQSLHLSQI